MRRFYLENLENLKQNIIKGHELDVPDSLIHRISKVLRFKDGDKLEFLNGKGLLVEAVFRVKGKKVFFISSDFCKVERSNSTNVVAVSLIRRERFDLLVEKAVELGADEIQPFVS